MTVEISHLSNGIRVVTDSNPQLQTASVGVWVDVGARYESVHENGISHLLEHMVFKGTPTRSARVIAEEIESVGGHLNAYTSRDHTTYYARVLKDDVPLAVDILADILQRSVFDSKELAREQDVVIQEIGQVMDTPDDIIFDLLQETAYPDQALGRSILGTEASVAAFKREDVHAFLSTHYCGRNMVIAGAGHVDHATLVALVNQAFGGLSEHRRTHYEPAQYVGGHRAWVRPLEQNHLCLGFNSLPFDHDDYYALQVYSTLLGGGMSSRLFQEVRENRGLAYSVYSFTSSHADTGLFGIYAGTSPEMMEELLALVSAEMRKVADDVSPEEVGRAAAQLKAGLLMSLESTSARIEHLGRQLLIFDRVIPVDEMIARVDAVDADAIGRLARTMFEAPLTTTIVGPKDGQVSPETVERLFQA